MILKVMLVQARCYARFAAKSRTSKMLADATGVHQQDPGVVRTKKIPQAILSSKQVAHKQNQETYRHSETKKSEKEVVSTGADGAAFSGLPQFTKIDDLDAQLKRIMLMVKSKKNREKSDRVLLEGKRLIQDAIQAGIMPESIIFSRVEDMKCMTLPADGIQLYKVPYKTIALWSDMTTCPGIMGIFKTPNVQGRETAGRLPLIVVCDNVREPGNLGAILRVAAGAGCSKVILMKGCVDLWEPKVLRAGSGAHFRLPIHKNVSASELPDLISADSSVFLADNHAPFNSAPLNNALNPSAHRGAFQSLVPCAAYDAIDYTTHKSVVLVIGGETEGLSDNAMLLAGSRNGARLNIPLDNEVESLNTGTALGIILFEIKRQLLLSIESKVRFVDRDDIQDAPVRSSVT